MSAWASRTGRIAEWMRRIRIKDNIKVGLFNLNSTVQNL
jgi:hypothetical protein